MEQITPFTSQHEALSVLDNGGRFYNLITKANDGNITFSELSKVVGLMSDKQKMVLYLELSLSKLSSDSRKEILKALSPDITAAITKYPTQYLRPSEAQEKGILAQNTVVEGIPKYVESKSDFSGFVMIPIMTGKVTTFMMVPIIDQYNVYELRDRISSETFFIAHSKESDRLPEKRMTFGGILKELKKEESENAPASNYLEIHYCLDV